MLKEVEYLNLAGETLSFANADGLYPVNRYQSLVLAAISEFTALLVAARRGCALRDLSAWEPCCGGGPAAVALKRLGLGYVRATDINPDALAACRANAQRNGVEIDSIEAADMLEDRSAGRFDLIACNPPCGVGPEACADSGDAMSLAVVGGKDGMELSDHLLTQAGERLTPEGSPNFRRGLNRERPASSKTARSAIPGTMADLSSDTGCRPLCAGGPSASRSLFRSIHRIQADDLETQPDGWYWRLTWIVEVSRCGKFAPAAEGQTGPSLRRPDSCCALSGRRSPATRPFGAMIEEFSTNGLWVD